MTRKGQALYQKLIPRLLRREQEILSCLTAQERKDFARVLGKIENSLGLVQTSKEATEGRRLLNQLVIPGRAAREPGISRFRVHRCAMPRNDGAAQALSICFAITGKYAAPEPASIACRNTLPTSSAPGILMPASAASSSA